MIKPDTYSEVYEILSYTNKELVMKIPIEILEKIKNKRNPHYISKIDKKDILNRKNISKQTLSVIAYLQFKYWMTNSERERIRKLSYDFKLIEEEAKKEKYSSDNIFNHKKNDIPSQTKVETDLLIIEKEKWYNIIFKNIKKIFKSKEDK